MHACTKHRAIPRSCEANCSGKQALGEDIEHLVLNNICDASLISHSSSHPLQVPPFGKGSLYIRPQLIGSGAILGVAPAPQYTFIVFVCPVGHYFKVSDFILLLFCLQLVLYFTRPVRTVFFTFRVVYLQLAC